ncbi:hypothetical protein EMIHUDRAFT_125289, partial [Emiliania huxleyi CCMP1516]|uniref:RING-type domain-containing protein n=2 Tax=Emiliania huxleyi TaxID=2903 RepID=A0A0D3I2Q0_EMIH1
MFGKRGYRDGTLLTTSVVPPKGRFNAPANAVAEDEARTREAAKRQKTEAEKRIVAERCPICWDSPPDQLVTAPCGHTFCRSCIMAALVIRKECPCCRESLSSHRALTHRSDPEVVPRHPEATELQPTAGEARQSAAGEARQRDAGE